MQFLIVVSFSSRRPSGTQRGFVGLFIILVLLGAVGAAIGLQYVKQQQRQLARTTGTNSVFPEVDRAIATFVATNRRLPCPASPTDPNGLEAPAPTALTTTCTHPTGVLPWGTLGIPLSSALDSWGRKLSYRVFAGSTGLTRTEGLNFTNCNTTALLASSPIPPAADGSCAAPASPPRIPIRGTRFADSASPAGLTVNDRGTVIPGIAYVVISHGPTGRGAYGADHGQNALGQPLRAPMPNAASREYANATAPVDNTYWILAASAAGSDPDNAAFFDDVVGYKSITDLQSETSLAPRDWGWVTLSMSFAPATVTPDPVTLLADSTLTITLTNGSMAAAELKGELVATLPTDMTIASSPPATTTCPVTDPDPLLAAPLIAAPLTGSVTLPTNRKIPGATETAGVRTNGTCTVTIPVTIAHSPPFPSPPVQTRTFTNSFSAGGACASLSTTPPPPSTDYLCTTVGWNIASVSATLTSSLGPAPSLASVTPSNFVARGTERSITLSGGNFVQGAKATFTRLPSTLYSPIPTTFVSSTSLTASFAFATAGTWNVLVTNPDGQVSGSRTFTVTPPPPAAFNITTLGAAGVTFTGNCAYQNPVTAFEGLTITAFANYAPVYVSVNSAGIGVVDSACNASSLSGANSNGERLRFAPQGDVRYLGLTLTTFNQNGSLATAIENARLRFYDSGGSLVLTRTISSCLGAFSSSNATFYLDAGTTFAYVDIDALDRADGSDSTLRVAGAAFCNVGPASACTTPATVGSVCP